jgi:hypothetical protein
MFPNNESEIEAAARVAMGTDMGKKNQGFGYFEPEMYYRALKGCMNCGHPHPLVSKPIPQDTMNCPQCGLASAPPGDLQRAPALLTGKTPTSLAAQFFLWAGRALSDLSKRI